MDSASFHPVPYGLASPLVLFLLRGVTAFPPRLEPSDGGVWRFNLRNAHHISPLFI